MAIDYRYQMVPINFHQFLATIDPRQVGRSDLQRGAFAQGRQAFRRARAALPEKLLLQRSEVTTVVDAVEI